jgi:type II restriction enzyme
MVTNRFRKWLENIDDDAYVFIKRLSGNDTSLTGGHQSGIYFPDMVMNSLFPSIQRRDIKNPDCLFTAEVRSHGVPEQEIRAVYYNGKFVDGGTRNEKRLTRWKLGVGYTPLQDVEMTGSLSLFCFNRDSEDEDCHSCSIWVCDNPGAEQFIEDKIGPLDPGESVFEKYDRLFTQLSLGFDSSSSLELPSSWYDKFPSGEEIIEYVVGLVPGPKADPDKRLIRRRKAEFEIFRRVEEIHSLERVAKGFSDMDAFMSAANSLSNRRKSRSGKSLENHLDRIFMEEGLEGMYGVQCQTEQIKKPDFIFPSCAAYHQIHSKQRLIHLAVKTTCKDRWRQIISEAEKINDPYLFTLQEGISSNQYSEMKSKNVTLVVPKPLHKRYPKDVRDEITSLSDFISEIKEVYT